MSRQTRCLLLLFICCTFLTVNGQLAWNELPISDNAQGKIKANWDNAIGSVKEADKVTGQNVAENVEGIAENAGISFSESPSPSPTMTPTPSVTPSSSSSPSMTPSSTPSKTPPSSTTPTATPTPTKSPSPTPFRSPYSRPSPSAVLTEVKQVTQDFDVPTDGSEISFDLTPTAADEDEESLYEPLAVGDRVIIDNFQIDGDFSGEIAPSGRQLFRERVLNKPLVRQSFGSSPVLFILCNGRAVVLRKTESCTGPQAPNEPVTLEVELIEIEAANPAITVVYKTEGAFGNACRVVFRFEYTTVRRFKLGLLPSLTPISAPSRSPISSATISSTPSSSVSASPSTTISPSQTASLSQSPSPTATSEELVGSPSPSVSTTQSASVSATTSIVPTKNPLPASPSTSMSVAPSVSASAAPSTSASNSAAASMTPSISSVSSETPSQSSSASASPSTTASASSFAAGPGTPSPSSSYSASPSATSSASSVPSTISASPSATPAASSSFTASPSMTASISSSATATPDQSPSSSASSSMTASASSSLSTAPSASATATASISMTPSISFSATATPSESTSVSATASVSASAAAGASPDPPSFSYDPYTPTCADSDYRCLSAASVQYMGDIRVAETSNYRFLHSLEVMLQQAYAHSQAMANSGSLITDMATIWGDVLTENPSCNIKQTGTAVLKLSESDSTPYPDLGAFCVDKMLQDSQVDIKEISATDAVMGVYPDGNGNVYCTLLVSSYTYFRVVSCSNKNSCPDCIQASPHPVHVPFSKSCDSTQWRCINEANLHYLNELRSWFGISQLTMGTEAMILNAVTWSRYLFEADKFEHQVLGSQFGCGDSFNGENLAWFTPLSFYSSFYSDLGEACLRGWRTSEGHYRNMLRDWFNVVAMGAFVDSTTNPGPGVWCTQVFSTSANSANSGNASCQIATPGGATADPYPTVPASLQSASAAATSTLTRENSKPTSISSLRNEGDSVTPKSMVL